MARSSLTSLALLLGLALLLPPQRGAAQEEAGGELQDAFFERIAVDVVNVEVYVRDKEGNPVTGLTRDDFEVNEDGKPVEIVNFYRVAGGEPEAPAATTKAAGEEAERAPMPTLPQAEPVAVPPLPGERSIPESQRLHVVVYVDNFFINPLNRNRVFSRLRTFLSDTLERGDQVMVASYDRSLKIRQPFTSIPEVVNRVLLEMETLSGSAGERESERADAMKEIFETESLHTAQFRAKQFSDNQYQEVNYSLDSLREMIDSLAGIPGRKMLLHVSDGIPMVPGQDLYQAIQQRFADITALGEAFSRDLSRRYSELIAQANSNRISFYTIDAGGLRTRSGMGAESAAINTMRPTSFMAVDGTRNSNLQGTLRMMANRTGGQAILNTNDVTAGLEEVGRDFGNYYSLGYRAPTSDRGRYHKIEVRLKAEEPGWSVRHRDGYRDKSPAARIADGTRSFLVHGYETNPLEVAIDLGEQSAAGDGLTRVPVRIRVPMSRLVLLPRGEFFEGRVMLYFGATDESGRDTPLQEVPLLLRIPRSSIEQARQDQVSRVIDATMRPGPHRLVVAVHDEIGDERSVLGRFVQVGSP